MAKKTTGSTATTNSQAILAKIIAQFKDQNRAEIKKWRTALSAAKHPETPKMFALQDLIDNLGQDGHIMSQFELRKNETLCNTFAIIDRKNGQQNEEKTELFKSKWFFDFMNMVLERVRGGYRLIELQNPATMDFALIPPRNTCGPLRRIYVDTSDSVGIDYSVGYERTIIEVGQPFDLGIMADLCGCLIWKRNAIQSWAEYTERFGMPMITATTNKSSTNDINKLEGMLKTLGEAAQAVLPEGTTIDIKDFQGKDAYQVYDKLIERMNSEMSKPVVGGTMVTDNGSSRSQSEVHERNLETTAWRDKREIEFLVNDKLIPLMQSWGWNVNPDTDKFIFEESYDITLDKHWTIVQGMLQEGYDVDQDWMSRQFNVKLVGKRTIPAAQPAKMSDKPGSFSANFK